MTAQPSTSQRAAAAPPARPPDGPAADGLDLDTHIALVEARLIAREQRLLHKTQQLRQRVVQVVAPRALLLKAVGGMLAGAGLVWAWRRGGGPSVAAPAPAHGPASAEHAGGAPQWLLSLVPAAWPWLPARWRNRISPATAAMVLGVAMPLISRWLAARRPKTPNMPPSTTPH